MISRNRLKYIRSLRNKKSRDEHRQFIVEGDKIIMDLLKRKYMHIDQLIATPNWLIGKTLNKYLEIREIIEASDREYAQITTLENPSGIMAVLDMPETLTVEHKLSAGISIALEKIQDPGNLGTILRTAAWFGVKTVYCSEDCVDCYNPKVVQSSMGAVLITPVCYTPLPGLLKRYNESESHTVYGTFMSGTPFWEADFSENALIVFGNESRGISQGILPYISERLHVPSHRVKGNATGRSSIESLNVAAAAAIVIAAFRMPHHR